MSFAIAKNKLISAVELTIYKKKTNIYDQFTDTQVGLILNTRVMEEITSLNANSKRNEHEVVQSRSNDLVCHP